MPKTRPELVKVYRYPVPQAGRYAKLRLDKNENVAGFPRKAIRGLLSGFTPHFLSAYPEPGPLYEKIARLHRLKPANVMVTAGSEMAIRYFFEAFLDRGDEVVYLEPSFAMFEVYADLCGAKSVKVACGRDLQFDPDRVIAAISRRTKIVAIANPNNPTGSVFAPKDLERIARAAARADALFLVDEAYYYFYAETMTKNLSRHKNLVVTRTFSKACGLASIRLGYAVGHASVIAEAMKLQPIDHASAFALKAGEYVLDHEKIVWDYARRTREGKSFLEREAARMSFRSFPSHANFLVLDLGPAREAFLREARRRGLLVPNGVRLPFPNRYVRVTVGPMEPMRRVAAALRAAARVSGG